MLQVYRRSTSSKPVHQRHNAFHRFNEVWLTDQIRWQFDEIQQIAPDKTLNSSNIIVLNLTINPGVENHRPVRNEKRNELRQFAAITVSRTQKQRMAIPFIRPAIIHEYIHLKSCS